MSSPIKVLIIDDHSLFCDGLMSLFLNYSHVKIVGTAGNGIEALESIPQLKPNCILLDLSMPLMDGWDAFDIISVKYPEIKIFILTMHKDEEMTRDFLQKGACDVLDKKTEIGTLVNKITEAAKKSDFLTFNKKSNDILSRRQIEILLMIAQGKAHKIIAMELDICERTVEYHKSVLYQKLNVKSNAELTQYAIKKGYLRA